MPALCQISVLTYSQAFEMQEVTVSLAKYIILKVQCDLLNFQGS